MSAQSRAGDCVYDTMDSPLGVLLITAEADGLTGIYFEQHRHGPHPEPGWRHASDSPGALAARILSAARDQLDAYFAGSRTGFSLPLAARGTPFQARVWNALREIPFGRMVSYAELARRIGVPTAVRAVGSANGRNPLSIVVPCHRVIGADGALRGFGGGVARKEWLLAHEGALPALMKSTPSHFTGAATVHDVDQHTS